MELDNYLMSIVTKFQEQYSFEIDDVVSVEVLTSINNIPEETSVLSNFFDKSEVELIRSYRAVSEKITYDDFTYILLKIKGKSFLLCVWDSDELYDNPYILVWKRLEK